jgi:1,4-dihydroxy-2-naphthoate octaprenyltransferase
MKQHELRINIIWKTKKSYKQNKNKINNVVGEEDKKTAIYLQVALFFLGLGVQVVVAQIPVLALVTGLANFVFGTWFLIKYLYTNGKGKGRSPPGE